MKKMYRVCKNEEFNTIIKKRRFVSSKNFTVYFQPNSLNHSRFGLSVSKKMGNAVFRNKVKRQLRMMISQNIEYKGNTDYIVMIKKQYIDNTYADNEQDLLKTFKKIKTEVR